MPLPQRLQSYCTIPFYELSNKGFCEYAKKASMSDLANKLLKHIDVAKSYVIRMDEQCEDDYFTYVKRAGYAITVQEVPTEHVYIYRDIQPVEVDELEIEAINCKNCAAPVPVGKLDSRGDTVVRCSYCGTYHTIRKRG